MGESFFGRFFGKRGKTPAVVPPPIGLNPESHEIDRYANEFRPGDLIRSANHSIWNYIDYGISSARKRGERAKQLGGRMISFAMLGNEEDPAHRSERSQHDGPHNNVTHRGNTAIVIDRAKLLQRLPHNVAATGYDFGPPVAGRSENRYVYDNSQNPTTVYGIPIRRDRDFIKTYYEADFFNSDAWRNDVIVYSEDPAQDPILTPDLWASYVVQGDESSLQRLRDDLESGIRRKLKHGLPLKQIIDSLPNVPIISAYTGRSVGNLQEFARAIELNTPQQTEFPVTPDLLQEFAKEGTLQEAKPIGEIKGIRVGMGMMLGNGPDHRTIRDIMGKMGYKYLHYDRSTLTHRVQKTWEDHNPTMADGFMIKRDDQGRLVVYGYSSGLQWPLAEHHDEARAETIRQIHDIANAQNRNGVKPDKEIEVISG